MTAVPLPNAKAWELTRRKIALRQDMRHPRYDDDCNEVYKHHPRTRYSRRHVLGGLVYLTPQENKVHYMMMRDSELTRNQQKIRKKRKPRTLRFTRPSKHDRKYNRGHVPIDLGYKEDLRQQQIQDVREIGMNALDAHMIPDLAAIVMEYVGGPREDKGICWRCYLREEDCPGVDGDKHFGLWGCELEHEHCDGVHWKSGPGHYNSPVTLFDDCPPTVEPALAQVAC